MKLRYITLICSLLVSCQGVTNNSNQQFTKKGFGNVDYVFRPFSNDKQEKIKSLMSLLKEETSYLIVKLTLIDGTNYDTENFVYRFKRDEGLNAFLNSWDNSTQWGMWGFKDMRDYFYDHPYYDIELYFYDKNKKLLNNGILFNDDLNTIETAYISNKNKIITIKEEFSNWDKLPNIDKMHDNWVESRYRDTNQMKNKK